MKPCTACGTPKPRAEFYCRAASQGGLQPVCKECDAVKRRARYTANHDVETANRREYQRTAAGAEAHKRAIAHWQRRSPEQRAANVAVGNALRDGSLTRHPCWVCGDRAEAHHPDYSRPLDVVWLCQAHHKQAHALVRAEPEGIAA